MKFHKTFVLVFMVAFACAIGSPVFAWHTEEMDNHTATYTGTWGTSTMKLLYYGDDYRYAVGSGSSTTTAKATFTNSTSFDTSGYYYVYARWSSASNRSPNAYFYVYDGATYRFYTTRNQTTRGGEWVYLGACYGTAGNYGKVEVQNRSTSTLNVVVADGVRWVKENIDKNDIVDEPGIEYSSSSNRSIASITSTGTSSTNCTYDSISLPASGYVLVMASGIAKITEPDHWVKVGISDLSGGTDFDGLAPMIEREYAEDVYADERMFHCQFVYYYSSSGTRTFYLKARKQVGTTGTVMWNPLVLLYFPSKY